jgi:two-component system, NtrC family, response regulator HupR/HoxA
MNETSDSTRKPSLLIVDDEPNTLALISQLFRRDLPVLTASNGDEALGLMARADVGVLLADQRMPGMSGTELLHRVFSRYPDVIRILLTAYADMDTLTEAINEGKAYRFVAKPWDNRELTMIIHAAMETFTLRRRNARLLEENTRLVEQLRKANADLEHENVSLRREVHRAYNLDNVIGVSSAIKEVLRLVEKAIESSATVLIAGETGTGKEVIARAIHYNGSRRAKKFVAQNCASMPESLLESELFGHVRGAFTGAIRDHRGLFEEATGGTIFLDEIGDMPMPMQVKLLRVLEEGEIRRVGGNDPITVDVRVISATHRNLRERIEQGLFRQDLYYRLDVFRINLPPLRERDGDVTLLARHFFAKYTARTGKQLKGLTPAALHVLNAYAFPGNVRELENEIERAVALADPGTFIDVDLLSHDVLSEGRQESEIVASDGPLRERMHEFERQLITQELLRHNRNRTHTAGKLGISVRALQKKIIQLGIRE